MHSIKMWISDHPYLAGALVLAVVVLFYVLRRGGSTTVVQSGPSQAAQATQDQAQIAHEQIAAQSANQNSALSAALAAKQIDASVALQIANLQSHSIDQQTLTAGQVGLAHENDTLQAIRAQTAAQVDIAHVQGDTTVQVAGIQSGVQRVAIQAALDAQRDNNYTSLAIANSNNNRDIALGSDQVAVVNSNNNRDISINNTQVAGAVQINAQTTGAQLVMNESNNRTAIETNRQNTESAVIINRQTVQGAVDINGQNTQAATTINQQNVTGTVQVAQIQGDVLKTQVQTAGNVAIAQTNAYSDIYEHAFGLIQSGQFNKGGQGGANQVAVFTALFGQSAAGVAAEIGANQPGNTPAGIIGSIGNAFKNIMAGLFGAGTPNQVIEPVH